MTSLSELKVYATYPHRCSYLDDREATTLFIDPDAPVDRELYSRLSESGFRRSGPHIYRPHCQGCNACIPARIPAARFAPNRTQRRLRRRNADLEVALIDGIDSAECYDLYRRYIEQRHGDGDMYPPSHEQYQAFLTPQWDVTQFVSFRLHGQLMAISVLDFMDNGLSAVYTFYEPDAAGRSLGTWVILWQIELARELRLPHVYLGYWISQCRKMAYKGRFRPLEIYRDAEWSELRNLG